MLFGTPEYMSPEQAKGEPPDSRVDVYAMGCLLFQLLAGNVPFRADSFMAILTQHMTAEVPELGAELLARSGAPVGIASVVCKALAKERDERYASIDDLAEAVRDAADAVTTEASHAGKGRADGGGRSRRGTRSQVENWTGSVRSLDEFDDSVDAEEPVPARSKTGLVVAIAVAVLAAGGAVGFSMLGGNDAEDGPASESRAPAGDPGSLPTGPDSTSSGAADPASPVPAAGVAAPDGDGVGQDTAASRGDAPAADETPVGTKSTTPTRRPPGRAGTREPSGDAKDSASRSKGKGAVDGATTARTGGKDEAAGQASEDATDEGQPATSDPEIKEPGDGDSPKALDDPQLKGFPEP
jgi:serine/threonine-protein kinase